MYTDTKLHKAIETAISKTPALVICDVTTEDIGPYVAIRIKDRVGSRGNRYYSDEDILERGGEGFCQEGVCYRHVYFCDETVPADVAAVLAGA